MLTPEELAALPDRLVKLYEELENQILADIARRVAKAGTITSTAEWQALRLKELGESTKFIRQSLAKINGLTLQEVNLLFKEAAERSDEFYQEIFEHTARKAVPLEENAFVQQLIQAGIEQTTGELVNLTQSMGFLGTDGKFKPVAKTYQRVMDMTQLQISSGAFDYTTAIKQAVKALAESGLRFVDYQSGWVNHADVAVRRAALSGIGQLTGKISLQNAELLETDLVEVTAHAGARDTGTGPANHKGWQGKVYSLSGNHPRYPSLNEDTGYGTGAGLKGWNCRHDFFPFIEGVSQRAYSDERLRNIDPPPFTFEGRTYTAYEATQQQRKLETAMRASKRNCTAFQAAGLEEDYTAAAIKLQRQRQAYKEFSHAAHLPTQNDRHQVLGFGRSEAGKENAVGRNLKYIQNDAKIKAASNLPKKLSLSNGRLKQSVNVSFPGLNGVVPVGAETTHVYAMAGKGTSTPIRDLSRLYETYPNAGPASGWQKKAGTCRTDHCQYEIHWYENNGTAPPSEFKLKGLKIL